MQCLSGGEIKEKLTKCLDLLFKKDKHLLEKNVNERSISNMLASYLRSEFGDWDVDCEYNKDQKLTKKLKSLNYFLKELKREDLIKDIDERAVILDIIVHKRSTDNNLLVIEIKKSTSSKVKDDFDIAKLKAFRKDKGYCFAVFLKVKIGNADKVGLEEMRWY